MRLLLAFLLAVTSFAAPRREQGVLKGAEYVIVMPERWNGTLILYCHGYAGSPVSFKTNPKGPSGEEEFIAQGVAVAYSGYSAGGWAIKEAIENTQALRQYIAHKYGRPKETYVYGHSMGGFLTMTLLEKFPLDYDGGLALCGPLQSAHAFFAHRAFDARIVFDFYFPGLLPDPSNVPASFHMNPELGKQILDTLTAKPQNAETVRRYIGLQDTKQVAETAIFFTEVLGELQRRAGGNAFDNHSTIYEGAPDDNALNAGVKRYFANPRATEYLKTYYTPTGHLTRPMLAIHTTFDQLVPPSVPSSYALLTQEDGAGDLFVQRYVPLSGHCNIPENAVVQGMKDLWQWKRKGVRPQGGLSPGSR